MLATELTPEECAIEVMETVPFVMRFLRAEMRRQRSTDLSVPQFRALGFLSRYPGASLSDLAEHLGITKATASATVDRLVRRGLIDRIDDPQERRRLTLTLTDEGNLQLQQARVAAHASVSEVLENLSQAKLLQITKGLVLLGEAFKEFEVKPKESTD